MGMADHEFVIDCATRFECRLLLEESTTSIRFCVAHRLWRFYTLLSTTPVIRLDDHTIYESPNLPSYSLGLLFREVEHTTGFGGFLTIGQSFVLFLTC